MKHKSGTLLKTSYSVISKGIQNDCVCILLCMWFRQVGRLRLMTLLIYILHVLGIPKKGIILLWRGKKDIMSSLHPYKCSHVLPVRPHNPNIDKILTLAFSILPLEPDHWFRVSTQEVCCKANINLKGTMPYCPWSIGFICRWYRLWNGTIGNIIFSVARKYSTGRKYSSFELN